MPNGTKPKAPSVPHTLGSGAAYYAQQRRTGLREAAGDQLHSDLIRFGV